MADLRLQMVIEAQNKARDELNKVKGQIEDVQSSMKKFSAEGKKTESSLGSSLNAIKGSWIAVSAAVAGVGFAIKSFVSDAMEAESANKRLETLLLNVKGATMEQVEALKAQANALQGLTTVADEAIISGQSQLATFNLQAATIAKVTPALLDMAVAVNGVNVSQEQMANISDIVGKAFNGQIGILSRYGISLTDSQEQILKTGSEMQKAAVITELLEGKFGGLAEQMKGTLEGRIAAVKNQFSDLKEELGGRVLPIVSKVLTWISEVGIPAIIKAGQFFSKAWREDWGAIRTIVTSTGAVVIFTIDRIKEAFRDMKAVVGFPIKAFNEIGDSVEGIFRGISHEQVKMERESQAALGGLGAQLKAAFTNEPVTNFVKENEKAKESLQSVDDILAKLNAGGGLGGALGGGGGAGKADEIKKMQEKIGERIADARQGYRDLVDTASEALLKLEEKHKANTEKIDANIQKLKDSLAELKKSYDETIKGLDVSAAEKVVEQEKKIADLQKQLQEGGASGDQQAVQAQLIKEQQALANFLAGNKELEDEITDARRRDQLTDLERFAEDLKVKKEKATEEFEAKKVQQEAELAMLEAQKVKEAEIYEAKRAEIQATMVQFDLFRDNVLANMDTMTAGIDTKTKIMEARLKQLQSVLRETIAIEETLAARSKAKSSAGGGRAFGGIVRPDEPVMVGERGPELFVPNAMGRVFPNGMTEPKQAVNVSVSVSGNNISSPADEDRLASKIAEMLTRSLQLRQLGSS